MVRWLTRQSLGVAVERWPAELRDEMRAEWLAELHVITENPNRTARLRGLGFALSLAVSRPASGDQAPTTGRDLWIMVKNVRKPAAAWLLTGAVLSAALYALLTVGSDWLPSSGPAYLGFIQLLILAVLVGGLVPLGRAIAGRSGLVPDRRPVVWAAALVAAGALVADAAALPVALPPEVPATWFAESLVVEGVASMAIWAAVVAVTGGWMARLVRRGRSVPAGIVAVGGVLVAVNLAMSVAAWVLPPFARGYVFAATPPMGNTFYEIPNLVAAYSVRVPQDHLVLAMAPYLMVALAAVVLAYQWRIARPVVAGQSDPVPDPASSAASPEPEAAATR
ncbi:MAG: hypothetical protein WCA46_25630 [Actinocatenispora sp.]